MNTDRSPRTRAQRPWPLLALLLLAFALRIWGLADHNIWWDEGLAAWMARLPVPQILDWNARDVHPPLYFTLLHFWWRVAGDGEFVLRFPSALTGTVGVAAIYGLGRAIGGRRAGLLAALFLTLSAFAVSWSQEMRMYCLASVLATGTLWAAFRLWGGPDRRAWIAYVALCAAGLWTLYLLVSVPLIANLAFGLVWLMRGRPRALFIRWVSAQAAAAALFLPWLIYALPRIPTWSTAEPFAPLTFVHLYGTMLAVGIPVFIESYTPFTIAAVAILAAGLAALWRTRHAIERRASIGMLLLGLLLPALIVYIVSLPIHIFYAPRLAPRYLLPLAACFYTLMAMGLSVIYRKQRWVAIAGIAIILVAAARGLADFFPNRVRQDDLISLSATLKAHLHPGDALLLYSDRDWPLFAAQYAGAWGRVPYGAAVDTNSIDTWVRPGWDTADGLWLVTTPDAQRIDPRGSIRAWLEANAIATKRWDYGDNTLAFYARAAGRADQMQDLGPQAIVPAGTSGAVPNLIGAGIPLARYPTGDVAHLSLYWSAPPATSTTVRVEGAASRIISAPPAAPARNGPTRQQVAISIQPDMPAGSYRIIVGEPGASLEVGAFTVVGRGSGNSAALADIPSPLNANFGSSIQLLGYGLPGGPIKAGGSIPLTLYWQTRAVVGARYKVFTHVVGETWNASTGNFLWGQQDNEPAEGTTPTTTWAPGAIITDRYAIPIPPNTPSGRYRLVVGLYGLIDGARLPVTDAAGAPWGDSVFIVEIGVEGR